MMKPLHSRAHRVWRVGMRVVAAIVCVTHTACYSFVSVKSPPARGSTIRVTLQDPIDVRLGNLTANEVVLLRGELIQMDSSTLAMSATWVKGRSMQEFAASGETVSFPRRSMVDFSEKRFSFAKTGIFGIALVGAALLIQGAFHPFGGGGSNGGGGGIQ